MPWLGQGIHPRLNEVQGHLAHKKTPSPRALQEAYAHGPSALLGGTFSYEEGTPVREHASRSAMALDFEMQWCPLGLRTSIQGCLAMRKCPPPLDLPKTRGHRPTVGS